jgi:GntP family gluconate:H+ symporter
MGAGVDMPYVGLTLPLLFLSFPAAAVIALGLGLRDLRLVSEDEMRTLLPPPPRQGRGGRLYFPIFLVLVLMILQSLDVPFFPGLGLPAIFFLGSGAGLVCGRRFNAWKATQAAIGDAMPILSILAGVGMFIQVMTLTGGRGWLVTTFLALPPALAYVGVAAGLPLFGGVSAFGSASVLGVPFVLAHAGSDAVWVAAALSAIVGLGDLMPPAAMAARFSGHIAGSPGLLQVLRYCLIPGLFILAWGVGTLLLAPVLGRIF